MSYFQQKMVQIINNQKSDLLSDLERGVRNMINDFATSLGVFLGYHADFEGSILMGGPEIDKVTPEISITIYSKSRDVNEVLLSVRLNESNVYPVELDYKILASGEDVRNYSNSKFILRKALTDYLEDNLTEIVKRVREDKIK